MPVRAISLVAIALAFCTACITTAPTISHEEDLEPILSPVEAEGIRWGYLVTDLAGNILAEHDAEKRFLPASNMKLLISAAAFHWRDDLEALGNVSHTGIKLDAPKEGQAPNLILIGRGDVGVSAAPDCTERCLQDLALSVAQMGLTEIGDIIADDSWFANERWNAGWSWEDLQERYGTAVSALIIDNNIQQVTLIPGAKAGERALVQQDGPAHIFAVANNITTVMGETRLDYKRLPGSGTLHISGTLNKDSEPVSLRLGIEDPALFAAAHLRDALIKNGVRVKGRNIARHRTQRISDAPAQQDTNTCTPGSFSPVRLPEEISTLPPPDFEDTLKTINKRSQNLYSEIVLRQLGKICGDGSSKDGLERVVELMERAGAGPRGYDLFDGSGMSVYNRLSPRAIHAVLLFAASQEWGEDWKATFPIGGVDGSLRHRFKGTALEGRIFAKTGTLKGVNALSGYMISTSGKPLVFSILANDRPLSLSSATPFMDAALIELAQRF